MRTEDASKFNKELQYIDVIEAASFMLGLIACERKTVGIYKNKWFRKPISYID
jgi:hypothetical protein